MHFWFLWVKLCSSHLQNIRATYHTHAGVMTWKRFPHYLTFPSQILNKQSSYLCDLIGVMCWLNLYWCYMGITPSRNSACVCVTLHACAFDLGISIYSSFYTNGNRYRITLTEELFCNSVLSTLTIVKLKSKFNGCVWSRCWYVYPETIWEKVVLRESELGLSTRFSTSIKGWKIYLVNPSFLPIPSGRTTQ